jgi:hypothetical protein
MNIIQRAKFLCEPQAMWVYCTILGLASALKACGSRLCGRRAAEEKTFSRPGARKYIFGSLTEGALNCDGEVVRPALRCIRFKRVTLYHISAGSDNASGTLSVRTLRAFARDFFKWLNTFFFLLFFFRESDMKLRIAVSAVLALTIASCYSPTEFVAPEKDFIVASGSAITSFAEAEQVKISYTKKIGGVREVFFIDFSEADPVPVQLKKPAGFESKNADSPLISPDGKWVAYSILQGNTPQGVYVQRLSADADPVLVNAEGTEPHWWTDADGSLYLIYSDVFFVTVGQLGSTEGKTMRTKLTISGSDVTVGATEDIAPYPMNGGLSKDGRYLATGYGDAAIYDLQTSQLALLNEGFQVCNPSISPSNFSTNVMLFLNFQGKQNLNGDFLSDPDYPADAEGVVAQHDVIYFVDNTNTVVDFIAVPSEYDQLQDPEWSYDEKFVTALGKISDTNTDGLIFNTESGNYTHFAKGLDITSTPFVWMSGATVTPDPIELNEPSDTATYAIGDTISLAWTVNATTIQNVGIKLFIDNATKEYGGNPARAIPVSEATSYEWVVTADQVGTGCVFKIYDNMDESVYVNSPKFTIQAAQ